MFALVLVVAVVKSPPRVTRIEGREAQIAIAALHADPFNVVEFKQAVRRFTMDAPPLCTLILANEIRLDKLDRHRIRADDAFALIPQPPNGCEEAYALARKANATIAAGWESIRLANEMANLKGAAEAQKGIDAAKTSAKEVLQHVAELRAWLQRNNAR